MISAASTRYRIRLLQRLLDKASSTEKKLWWEKYLRGTIGFRGVGIPDICDNLSVWRERTGLAERPESEQLEVALALFEESAAEDKLAGTLYLQYYLYNRLPWKQLFARYASLFENELIFDWNTCDWFCVRVLGPTLVEEGVSFARSLVGWKDAAYLWQARSSAVPFTKAADEVKYYPFMEEVCSALILRNERFAKTAVGWVLREVSRHDQAFVQSFLGVHVGNFSLESLRNAVKYLDEDKKNRYLYQLKNK